MAFSPSTTNWWLFTEDMSFYQNPTLNFIHIKNKMLT